MADAARKAEAKYQAQLRAEAEANAHDVVEQEAKAKMEAQRPKIEADAREKAELERPRYEDAARAKIEAETKAKVDAEMRDKVEAETRANTDEDARAQTDAATREKDDAQIRAGKAARERAAAELVARERDAHRVAINPSAPISPTLDTPSDFAAAHANVTALAQQNGIGPRHFCDKGYCANEIVQRTGIATFFAYVISPEGAAQFSSLCWQSGGPTRTCYTSLGRAWLDQPDGRGGWRTISQIRAQFPY